MSVEGSASLDSDKPCSSMVEIQCLLDKVGATELVIDLIVSTKNDLVFEQSILLGIALLKGGNTQIQVRCTDIHAHCSQSLYLDCVFIIALTPTQNSFYNQLFKQKNSEKFFKVFYDRLDMAQQEIRSTVSVNMFDFSCRKREDDNNFCNIRFRKGKLYIEVFHLISFVYLL